MKGYTSLPFARQLATMAALPDRYEPDFGKKNFSFWARVTHFEYRYKSINELLAGLPVQNILELSSGFSLRGLDTALNESVHYIDSDLPAVIEEKKELLAALQPDLPSLKGQLELLPLNALDQEAFIAITRRFAPGPLAIVNEGLLVYLDTEEKRKLYSNIHSVLKEHGGYWITADIYIKQAVASPALKLTDQLESFLEQHKVEEKKFESMEKAAAFFESEGFVIEKEATADYTKLDTLKYLLASSSPEHLQSMAAMGRIHATWRLKAV